MVSLVSRVGYAELMILTQVSFSVCLVNNHISNVNCIWFSIFKMPIRELEIVSAMLWMDPPPAKCKFIETFLGWCCLFLAYGHHIWYPWTICTWPLDWDVSLIIFISSGMNWNFLVCSWEWKWHNIWLSAQIRHSKAQMCEPVPVTMLELLVWMQNSLTKPGLGYFFLPSLPYIPQLFIHKSKTYISHRVWSQVHVTGAGCCVL